MSQRRIDKLGSKLCVRVLPLQCTPVVLTENQQVIFGLPRAGEGTPKDRVSWVGLRLPQDMACPPASGQSGIRSKASAVGTVV